MTLLDGSRNHKDTVDRVTAQPPPPAALPETPLPQREETLPETTAEKEHTDINDRPTCLLPAANIPELPPTIRLESTRRPLAYSSEGAAAEGYVPLLRTLVKSSGIYALSSVASPFVSLLLAPFLTRSLSHHDYGALAVLNTVIALMAGVTQFGLNNAFFRAYNFDYESQRDRLRVLSTVVALLLLISIPATIAVMGTGSWLADLLLKSPSLGGSVRLAALVVLLQNLTVPGFSWLRAENRATLFSILAVINLLVNLITTIILVGVVHMGIAGSLLAAGGGYAVIAVCTLPLVLLRAGLRLHFDVARNLLSFGLPLSANFVSVWILQLSDRYLLSHFGSLANTAGYAVAYSLGGVLGVIILAPFSLAWPSAMFAIAKRDNAGQIFQLVFRWYSAVLLSATFALSLIATFTLDIFFPPSYYSSASIIPLIATSSMLYGVYSVFTVGVSIQRKTWLGVIFTTFAAVVNVGLNLILIPLYGSMGAALSTLLAYAALALLAYIVNQRIYPVPFEVGIFTIALLTGVALYAGIKYLAPTQETYRAWGISLGALGLYCGCLFFLAKGSVRKGWEYISAAVGGFL